MGKNNKNVPTIKYLKKLQIKKSRKSISKMSTDLNIKLRFSKFLLKLERKCDYKVYSKNPI